MVLALLVATALVAACTAGAVLAYSPVTDLMTHRRSRLWAHQPRHAARHGRPAPGGA